MKEKIHRILAINPGSTSTKIGVFDDEKCVVEKVIRHTREELDACGGVGVYNQKNLRRRLVLETLSESGISLESLDATVGRAARLPPMASGTYAINDALMQAIPDPLPSPGLLGMVIAKEFGDELKIPSFIVDPANVDEFWELSRVTGIPDISRISSFHTLNHKAVGRRAAAELGKSYDDCRFVIAHMGGGMSIAAHPVRQGCRLHAREQRGRLLHPGARRVYTGPAAGKALFQRQILSGRTGKLLYPPRRHAFVSRHYRYERGREPDAGRRREGKAYF